MSAFEPFPSVAPHNLGSYTGAQFVRQAPPVTPGDLVLVSTVAQPDEVPHGIRDEFNIHQSAETRYFEWVQDRQGMFWTEREVNERLKKIIDQSFEEVIDHAVAHEVNNRTAAYMLAIDRVAFALKERGIYA